MSYHISYQDRILKIDFSQRVSTEELLELDKEIFSNWDKDDCVGHLYNYLLVDAVNFTEIDMKRIALVDKNESFILGPLKIAIVVTDESIAKFSRMYAEGLDGSEWNVALFTDEPSALAFITNN